MGGETNETATERSSAGHPVGALWRWLADLGGRGARRGRTPPKAESGGGRKGKPFGDNDEEGLSFRMVVTAFTSLPRVIRLVWEIHPTLTLLLAVLYIAQGFVPALTAYVAKLLFDDVLYAIRIHGQRGAMGLVIWLVVAQFAVQALSSLLTTLSNIAQQLLQERTSYAVQLQVMEKANTLDLAFFEDARFYDSLQQAQREAATRPIGMISQTFGLGRTLVTLFSAIFVLIHLAWWLAILALLAPIPAFVASMRYGWWGYQVMRRQSPLRREMSYYNTLLTTDTFNKEVKLFTLGDFFIRLYRTLAERFYHEARALIVPRYLAAFAWGLGSLVLNGVVYLYVAVAAVAGRISFGDLTLYTQMALSLGTSFQGLLSGISSTYENNLFVNTLFEFLEYEPRIVSPPDGRQLEPSAGLAVEFRQVSFSYPGRGEKGQALRDVSFRIEAGDTVALVGRNGAGKTTIVKLLTRLYDADAGQILINGYDIREYDLASLRAGIGVIFQDYVTYYLSAGRNIGVGRIAAVEDTAGIRAAAAKSGADAVIGQLPEGYESMLGKWFDQGQQLSGGEWQKIALARAFMRDAPLLILDEPTSSLDPQAEYEVFARFRELTAGKSAIFISHRFSTVRLANRILVLEDGGILEEGTHAELLALGGRYAELFTLQAEAYR
ncbi:MAG: ABC transporter ATP-binding protein [Ktedonobacterales bacterium]|nr:ABC transporter ATP-binding protein [Ktedonobacterales bacterium]